MSSALVFGRAVVPCRLQYIEEPVLDSWDIPEFFLETGIPVALDECLDMGLLGPGVSGDLAELLASKESGVAALVLKPAVLGGFERCMDTARWAHARSIQVGFVVVTLR